MDQPGARFVGLDYVVDEAVFGGHERAGESILEFGDLLLTEVPVFDSEFAAVDDIDGSFRAHDGDLDRWPGRLTSVRMCFEPITQ